MKPTRYCPYCETDVPECLIDSGGNHHCGSRVKTKVLTPAVQKESNAMNPYWFWGWMAAIGLGALVVGVWGAGR